jgi:hypothetical protein
LVLAYICYLKHVVFCFFRLILIVGCVAKLTPNPLHTPKVHVWLNNFLCPTADASAILYGMWSVWKACNCRQHGKVPMNLVSACMLLRNTSADLITEARKGGANYPFSHTCLIQLPLSCLSFSLMIFSTMYTLDHIHILVLLSTYTCQSNCILRYPT